MMDQNTCFAYLNMELPDDIRRLKEAGYYDAAIARIDACLAEDWTASQNQPLHPQGALPVNPTPHGVDAWRQGLLDTGKFCAVCRGTTLSPPTSC